ncbi:hypothetical protein ACFPRL_32415 [Pseudoclavibacter helvolus]
MPFAGRPRRAPISIPVKIYRISIGSWSDFRSAPRRSSAGSASASSCAVRVASAPCFG